MGRPRKGSLAFKGGTWNARLTTGDGRSWIPLDTKDEAEARKKLVQLRAVEDERDEKMETYADRWLRQREAAEVVMAKEEYTYWKLHCRSVLGPLRLRDVRAEHVSSILDELVKQRKAKQTVRHVKGFLHRLFDAAWRASRIETNPIDKVKLPKIREVKKERVTLSDEEFSTFVMCDQVDEELRMLALCSRILGGARTSDLHRLTWELFDAPSFETVILARNKTGTPQRLGVPETVRPLVRRWWEGQGGPSTGPVFPARRGDRKGLAKLPESSYAKRLRRELLRAGVTRPELFQETGFTKPVDFHSFRRAFVGALSTAGVNLQTSMKLAGHTSARTHAGYIVGVQEIPAGVVPDLSSGGRTSEADPQEGTPEGTRTPDPRLRRPPQPCSFAPFAESSGSTIQNDPLPTRLVAALADDPQLLARVLGKLLAK